MWDNLFKNLYFFFTSFLICVLFSSWFTFYLPSASRTSQTCYSLASASLIMIPVYLWKGAGFAFKFAFTWWTWRAVFLRHSFANSKWLCSSNSLLSSAIQVSNCHFTFKARAPLLCWQSLQPAHASLGWTWHLARSAAASISHTCLELRRLNKLRMREKHTTWCWIGTTQAVMAATYLWNGAAFGVLKCNSIWTLKGNQNKWKMHFISAKDTSVSIRKHRGWRTNKKKSDILMQEGENVLVGITKSWWKNKWNGMERADRYNLFKRNKSGKAGPVALYIR